MGGGSRKARSRHHEKVKRAAHNQKQHEGETPNGATLKGAERRASRRAAKNPVKLARVQETMGSADVAARKHLENWQDPEIPVAELEDAYDPAFELRRATHTASLRDNADIDRFAARAAVSGGPFGLGIAVLIWCYVDDVTLRAPLAVIHRVVAAVKSSLEKFGCRLKLPKCWVCVPAGLPLSCKL